MYTEISLIAYEISCSVPFVNRRTKSVSQALEWDSALGQLILDAAGDGIFGLDAAGRTTFANPAACEMMGYSKSEMLGVSSHDLIHYAHRDGTPYSSSDCPIYAAFSDGRIHSISDDVFWKKDGAPIQVEYTSTPLRRKGRLIGAVVVFRNVTPLRKSEENLRAALAEVEQLRDRLSAENSYLQEEIELQNNFDDVVGHSPAMENALKQAETVAPTPATVLVSGETGTGKELFARAIHRLSGRKEGPFIKVNCAAIPDDLFESEFFGHIKGAFTGAVQDRPGRFELADGGTLFLDEVGELPVSMQSKLLRVLQEGEFERVGESRVRKIDVRIVAATNRDLRKAVESGSYRSDLFYRLNVFPIEIAPLRFRREDIADLARRFLQVAKVRFNRPAPRLSIANIKRLEAYDWPGNVRELQNVIERATIISKGKRLQFKQLDLYQQEDVGASNAGSHEDSILSDAEMKTRVKDNIRAALRKTGGRIYGAEGAAALLAMKPTTLFSYVRKHNLKYIGIR